MPLFIPTPPLHPLPKTPTRNFPHLFPKYPPNFQFVFRMASSARARPVEFEDFLPTMAERLGEAGLMAELCNGFRLLMDPGTGLITLESLKRNSALLGLDGLSDDELRVMVREGDMDGDGGLSEMEFCVLMVRLSPDLMDEAFHQIFDSQ